MSAHLSLAHDPEIERLRRRAERERQARKEAERLLDEKSRSLYEAKATLERANQTEKQNTIQFRAVLDGMPIAVLTTDAACKILSLNYMARSYFGTTSRLARGRAIAHILPKFEGIADAELAVKIVEASSDDIPALRSDGTAFPCEVTVTRVDTTMADLLADKGGMYIWTARDATTRVESEKARKQMEEDLRQAHRLESLGTMAGGIAHELNTPIQFISDNMRYLDATFRDLVHAFASYRNLVSPADGDRIAREADIDFIAEETPTAIKQSLDGLSRMAEIVLAIKRFSHPSNDVKASNDFNEIVTTAAAVSKNQWKYVADLDLVLDPTLPPVVCNPGEINQALVNLIVNATHAIEDKGDKGDRGKITVTTKRAKDSVVCSVSDTGVGIPRENQDKIFDLFFTTKGPGRGTGQGLALVHTIVTQSHGGRITVDSTLGTGTTFAFTLPIEQASALEARDH